jgi:hypothetical protein
LYWSSTFLYQFTLIPQFFIIQIAMRELGTTDARSATLPGPSEFLDTLLISPFVRSKKCVLLDIENYLQRLLILLSLLLAAKMQLLSPPLRPQSQPRKPYLLRSLKSKCWTSRLRNILLWLWQGSLFCSQPFTGVDSSTVDILQRG